MSGYGRGLRHCYVYAEPPDAEVAGLALECIHCGWFADTRRLVPFTRGLPRRELRALVAGSRRTHEESCQGSECMGRAATRSTRRWPTPPEACPVCGETDLEVGDCDGRHAEGVTCMGTTWRDALPGGVLPPGAVLEDEGTDDESVILHPVLTFTTRRDGAVVWAEGEWCPLCVEVDGGEVHEVTPAGRRR